MVMVIIIAICGIVVVSTTRVFENMTREVQLNIDKTRAHYLAQAGVVRAVWKWYTDNDTATTYEAARSLSPINSPVPVAGGTNMLFKTGTDSAGVYLQSNYAYVVPGLAFVKNVGVAQPAVANTVFTTFTVPANTTVPVGNFVVVAVVMDAVGITPIIDTVAGGAVDWLDSKGNTYTLRQDCANAAAATVVRTVVFSAPITTAITTGDTINVRWTNNVAAKAISVFELSGVDTYDANFNAAAGCANVANGVGGTIPASPSTAPAVANEILVGAIGIEGRLTETFTAGDGFLANPPTEAGGDSGTAASSATICPEYRIVNTAAASVAKGRNSASRDWAAVQVGFYSPNHWINPAGSTWRLKQWQIYNIHNASNIVLAQVKISWSPANAELVNDFVLNGTSVWPAATTAASGVTTDLTAAPAANRTLASGAAWSGNNTYIQWNNSVNGVIGNPATVTCQFIFSGDSTTSDDKTAEIVMWNGVKSGAGMPSTRIFTVTSTGQVNQTVNAFKVLKSIKAQVSGGPVSTSMPGKSRMEIMDWDEEDKNAP